MKRIAIIIAAIAVLAGCAVVKPMPQTTAVVFSDYRPYAEEGFLISPNPYTYDFESVGEIYIVTIPAIVEKKAPRYPGSNNVTLTLAYDEIDRSELVATAVKEAKAKGADAIVNFSIRRELIQEGEGIAGIIGYKYITEGYCIKRK